MPLQISNLDTPNNVSPLNPTGGLPSRAEWKELTGHTICKSAEWKAVNAAYKQVLADPGPKKFRDDLLKSLNEFDEVKKKKYGQKGFKGSVHDSKGTLSALRNFLEHNPPEITEEDLKAIQVQNWAQDNAFRRSLLNARIKYKGEHIYSNDSARKEIAQDLVSSTKDFISDGNQFLKQIGIKISGPTAVKQLSTQVDAEKQRLIDQLRDLFHQVIDLAGEFKHEALRALKTVIGDHVYSEILGLIPFIGDIKNGKDVLTKIKNIVDNELLKKTIINQSVYTRVGDVSVAISGIQSILSSRRVDLALDLSTSTINLVSGFASFGTAGAAVTAVNSFLKLLKKIYDFIKEFVVMKVANKALKALSTKPTKGLIEINRIVHECPFLGAYVITVCELNTLLQFDGAMYNDPFFISRTYLYRQRIDAIKETAYQIIKQSRLEVVQDQRVNMKFIQDQEVFHKDYAPALLKELERRQNRAAFEMRQSQVGAHKAQMQPVFTELKTAVDARENRLALSGLPAELPVPTTSKEEFDFLKTELSVIEERPGITIEPTPFEKLMFESDAYEVAVVKLLEPQLVKSLADPHSEKLGLLQERVKSVLTTYKSQTTGFNKLVTRQSKESTAAIAALTPLVNSLAIKDKENLKGLVEFLLKKPGSTVPSAAPMMKPLNQPSRLYSLLEPAYSSVY